jgi:hypothetical protein
LLVEQKKNPAKLEVKEDPNKGVFIKGGSVRTVKQVADL